MANHIQVQICGGESKEYNDVATIGELRTKMGLAKDQVATIKGEPADETDKLRDYDVVGFAKATAGGR